MEGVMMRNGDAYALAVRRPDGVIHAQRLPWFSLTRHPWLKKPFARGFPVLLETLINGIQALNRSVEAAAEAQEEKLEGWHLALTLGLALLMAVGLFVVAPHLLSLVMLWLHLGGDVEGLSFHLWDGFFKCCIFMGYIWLISPCAGHPPRVSVSWRRAQRRSMPLRPEGKSAQPRPRA